MDVQLQELIDRIKSEGVASAEKQAAAIIEEAEKKAKALVTEAEASAQTIIEAAKQKEEQMVRSGRDALTQAGRDLLLNLQDRLIALFNAVIETKTAEVFTGNNLESAVVKIVSAWSTGDEGKVDVLLPEKQLSALESSLRKQLSDKLAEGIELKPSTDLNAGFRISVQNGSAYYDFTPAEIAAILSQYLNPRLAEILQKASTD